MTNNTTTEAIEDILAIAGLSNRTRDIFFDAFRQAEKESKIPHEFREKIRWPLIACLLRDVKYHQVEMENGLTFEVGLESRIERAFLLSVEAHPDHVWEPQTTKLLVLLGAGEKNVLVGGAYIGDHVLLIAQAMIKNGNTNGRVHAFEPDTSAFLRLSRHLSVNALDNVLPSKLGLWEKSNLLLHIEGDPALSITSPVINEDPASDLLQSVSIDDYVKQMDLRSVGLIMLDIEGAEEKALLGADHLLSRPIGDAPNIVFEIHRNYVDWTAGLKNTSVVKFVESKGYTVFAIRDFHDNYPMLGRDIEVIPVETVYLEGPPHGFNLFATKDKKLIDKMGLKVVQHVSPKLLVDKDPLLHHPVNGL